MKVVIIEDEAPAFRRLQKILEEVDSSIEIIEVIDSVEEAVKWIENHHEPDLFFMDIQLSDGISFEIFDQIKINKPIIFTTAFDEYMLKAFKVNSIDYLLKPIKKEDMAKSLRKFNELRNHYTGVDIGDIVRNIHLAGKDYKSRFLVKQGDKLISVKTEDIFLFQTRHGVVHITTVDNKRYLLDQPLDEIQENLDPTRYFRANRQFILSFAAITTVHKYHKGKLLVETTPSVGDEIIVSAEKATKFKVWLDQ